MNEMNTVAEWVGERISRAELFEDLGIDFCCGGNRTLKEACEERQIPLLDVLYRLRLPDSSPNDCSWVSYTSAELCDHIEQTHHAYLKKALPRIAHHLEKIVLAHGESYLPLLKTFSLFTSEIESHMDKEEGEVFPLYRSADLARLAKIHELEEEHQEAGRLLAEMRRLAHNYQLPPHSCNTLKLAWSELEYLEADMHLHVFKENHYLFPRK